MTPRFILMVAITLNLAALSLVIGLSQIKRTAAMQRAPLTRLIEVVRQ